MRAVAPADRVISRPSVAHLADALLPIGLASLALLVRLYQLDSKSFWFDEVMSVYNADQPLGEIWAAAQRDVHPPLYYLVLHAWLALGHGDWHLRLFSVLPSAATVPLTYLLGRRLFSPFVGTLGAALLALSPFHIALGQEARMYALFGLFAAASLLLLHRALEQDRLANWLAYALTGALVLWTHYFGLLLLTAQAGGIVGAAWRRPKLLGHAILALGLAGLLFLPWVPALVAQAGAIRGSYWIPPVKETTLWETVLAFTFYSPPDYGDGNDLRTRIGGVVFLALALLGAQVAIRRGGVAAILIAVVIGPVLLALVLSAWFMPIYVIRYFVFAVPAFLLLVAAGVGQLPGSILRAVPLAILLLGLVVSLGAFYRDPYYARPDFRQAAHEIVRDFRPGDVVMHSSVATEGPTSYYTGGRYPSIVLDPVTREEARTAGEDYRRLWLVWVEDVGWWRDAPDPRVAELMADFRPIRKHQVTGAGVYLFEVQPPGG